MIAEFERNFYVAAPGGIVCVGLCSLGDGPLNVLLTPDSSLPDWKRLDVTPSAKGRVDAMQLSVGTHFSLALECVPHWRPAPWPGTTRNAQAIGVAQTRALAADAVAGPGQPWDA